MDEDLEGPAINNGSHNTHIWSYNGKFWSLPENFEFPQKVKRRRAWELWLRGMEASCGKRICPFRNFSSSSIPTRLFQKFKIEWKPIMQKMENSPGLKIQTRYSDVNQFLIDSTFGIATTHLRENVCSYLFKDKNKSIESWTVGTWSFATQRSQIIKKGTESDILNLPEANSQNIPHKQKRTIQKVTQGVKISKISSSQRLDKGNFQKKRKASVGKTLKNKGKPRMDSTSINSLFASAFPSAKSPHHSCTFTDCHVDGHLFYKVASEKCNICNLELHHVCMIEHGTNVYGEASEQIGLKKLCKSCFTKAAEAKCIKHV